MTTQPSGTGPLDEAILTDRYDGLLVRKRTRGTDPNLVGTGTAGDYNRLQLELDLMLTRLCEGTIRSRLDESDPITGELEAMIRERVIDWALEQQGSVR